MQSKKVIVKSSDAVDRGVVLKFINAMADREENEDVLWALNTVKGLVERISPVDKLEPTPCAKKEPK